MFFRPNFQFFSIFLLRCLPVFKKRRFGAILRAKQTRFSYRWDSAGLTMSRGASRCARHRAIHESPLRSRINVDRIRRGGL